MSALICGSMAFDTIMVFQDQFKNHILPEQVHILNVSFLVPEMRRNFGGCAGNIAFNLRMLEGDGLPMGTVGSDFGPYAAWMDEQSIPRSALREIPRAFTAQAYITTDMDDNQITAFHPGAMNQAHEVRVDEIAGVTLGMVSPDGRQGMIDHAAQFAEAGIPFALQSGFEVYVPKTRVVLLEAAVAAGHGRLLPCGYRGTTSFSISSGARPLAHPDGECAREVG